MLQNKPTISQIMENQQGLMTIKPKIKVADSYTLSLVYSPGVGQVCLEIQSHPDLVYDLTMTVNSIAVITDGSALNILHTNELIPKLESQAALFKFFYNIDVFPFILDPKLCKSAEDILMIIENLAPVYKIIDLKFISDERLQKLLPMLEAKHLGVTVLYKDLWSDMVHRDAEGKYEVKNYMNSLIVEAAVVRAILDKRAYIPVGAMLKQLVDHTWKSGQIFLQEIPNQITEVLLKTYICALNFLHDFNLNHITVKNVHPQIFINRLMNFYFYGKKSYIRDWGNQDHNLNTYTMNQNSVSLHRRYSGMIGMSTKFKPRSLEEAYDIFFRSYSSDDIKILEDKIRLDPSYADKVTFKSNLMAIMTNGTAILGFGDIGPSAGLPVMEGKAVLFKSLAGIDVVPVCIKEKDPVKVIHILKMIAPLFTAINLEDIKAPECFQIENQMIEDLNIPVMHDDQHGTAVVCLASIINGLKLMKKKPNEVKLVINGAGAAGLAICELLLGIGLKNIIICDTVGAIYLGRPNNMNEFKNKLAAITNLDKVQGSLDVIIKGADLFIGVSVAGALTPEHVKSMNKDPFILALANPNPEIMPDVAKQAGAFIVATGRSDFKNQTNNSLAFPGIFRAAIDTKARRINTEMKLAAAYAIANLVSDQDLNPDYIIPHALNLEIPSAVAFAVAEAAIKSGVAQNPNVTPQSVRDFTRKLNIEGMVSKI